jgi:hypothetical protein
LFLLQSVLEHQLFLLVGFGHRLFDLSKDMLVFLHYGSRSSGLLSVPNDAIWMAEPTTKLGRRRPRTAATSPPTSALALLGVRPGGIRLVELFCEWSGGPFRSGPFFVSSNDKRIPEGLDEFFVPVQRGGAVQFDSSLGI